MKKGLIALGLGFVLVFLATEVGGGLVLATIGGVVMIFGCVMFGLNIGSGSKSSGTKNTTASGTKPSEPKPTPKPEPKPAQEPAKPKGKFCRHCGTKVADEDIYCIECGNRL